MAFWRRSVDLRYADAWPLGTGTGRFEGAKGVHPLLSTLIRSLLQLLSRSGQSGSCSQARLPTNRAGNDFGPFSAKYSNDSSSTGIQLLLHCLSLYILPPRPDSGDGLLQ